MEWSDIAETVGKVAPAAGAALYGPAGAAVGGLVSRALGVEQSPEAVAQAIADPQAAERLRRLDREHEREILSLTLQAETTRLAEINKTMRAETESDSAWRAGWRPFNGWMLALSLASVNIGLVAVVIMDPAQLPEVVDVLIWSVVAQGAVQGVNIKQRSNDKARQLGQAPSGFMDAIKTRVSGK
ncbi:3TM-type holin [uncultured Halomonas sp.]|uniref:3TM-type holin n=1 Tax=uncultured Halomonas sp. TaxID=173971 RepID=UPI00262DC602|nr:3TM-type holin [uncultured Halomonas sp.]